MCCGFRNNPSSQYGHNKLCWTPIGVYGLYQVNDFVRDLNECDLKGHYKHFTAQRMAGKIFGTLGLAGVVVAGLVEAVGMIALGILALLPSLLFKEGSSHVSSMIIVAVQTIVDIPVRALSCFVQNILFNEQASFTELDVFACLTNSCSSKSGG